MANAYDIASTLISDSVIYNRIEHAEYSAALEEILTEECEGSVDTGETVEFWGADDDGDEWRVHLERRGE